MPHWKTSVHPHVALVVPFQTSATFAISNGETEAGANTSGAECLWITPFVLSVLFYRDLQSLFHHAATESWLISVLGLAKEDTTGLKIPMMETYMTGFTAGSKMTCTDSLQLSGEAEIPKGSLCVSKCIFSFCWGEALAPSCVSIPETVSEEACSLSPLIPRSAWVTFCL